MLLYNTGFFSTSGKINSVLLVFHRMIVSFSLLSCELNPPLLFVLKHGIYWARAIKCGLTIQHHLVSHTTLCAWPYGKGLQKVHGKYILWKWKNLLMDFKEFFFLHWSEHICLKYPCTSIRQQRIETTVRYIYWVSTMWQAWQVL